MMSTRLQISEILRSNDPPEFVIIQKLIPETDLDLHNCEIKKLIKLKYLFNIEFLNLKSNNIKSIIPILEMRHLIHLNISDNPISNEQQLYNVRNLKKLKFINILNTPLQVVCDRLYIYELILTESIELINEDALLTKKVKTHILRRKKEIQSKLCSNQNNQSKSEGTQQQLVEQFPFPFRNDEEYINNLDIYIENRTCTSLEVGEGFIQHAIRICILEPSETASLHKLSYIGQAELADDIWLSKQIFNAQAANIFMNRSNKMKNLRCITLEGVATSTITIAFHYELQSINLDFCQFDKIVIDAVPQLRSFTVVNCLLHNSDTKAIAEFSAARLDTIKQNKQSSQQLQPLQLKKDQKINAELQKNWPVIHFFNNIKDLNISGNKIQTVEWIASCPLLERLNASRNRIVSIFPLAPLKNLVLVDLQENPIHFLKQLVVFRGMTRLVELNLLETDLMQNYEFEEVAKKMFPASLVLFNDKGAEFLVDNKLNSVELKEQELESVVALEEKRILRIIDQQISQEQMKHFEFDRIYINSVTSEQNNSFSSFIEKQESSLKYLTIISMSQITVKEFIPTKQQFPLLEQLVLNKLQLEKIDLQNIPQLKYLEIYNNSTEIEFQEISSKGQLERLNIQQSLISKIDFIRLENSIKYLNLQGNNIRSLCPLELLKDLIEVNLQMNPIDNEQEIQIFFGLTKLRRLNIKDTPILQSYHIEYMLAYVMNKVTPNSNDTFIINNDQDFTTRIRCRSKLMDKNEHESKFYTSVFYEKFQEYLINQVSSKFLVEKEKQSIDIQQMKMNPKNDKYRYMTFSYCTASKVEGLETPQNFITLRFYVGNLTEFTMKECQIPNVLLIQQRLQKINIINTQAGDKINYFELSKNSCTCEIQILQNAITICVSRCLFSDIKFLEKNESTVNLYLSNNYIQDISMLKSFENLITLDVSSNKIKSLEGIKHARNLLHLNASYNEIENIYYLQQIKTLQTLILNNNPIQNEQEWQVLSYFESILCLCIQNTPSFANSNIITVLATALKNRIQQDISRKEGELKTALKIDLLINYSETFTTLVQERVKELQNATSINPFYQQEDEFGLAGQTNVIDTLYERNDNANQELEKNTEIQFTSSSKTLRKIYCFGTNYNDISLLYKAQNLDFIKFIKCKIEKVDSFQDYSFEKLEQLNLTVQKLKEICIKNQPMLRIVDLCANSGLQVKLANLPHLCYLNLSMTDLNNKSMESISQMQQIEYLIISHNQIDSLHSLEKMTNLVDFDVSDNPIVNKKELNIIEKFIDLRCLNIENTPLYLDKQLEMYLKILIDKRLQTSIRQQGEAQGAKTPSLTIKGCNSLNKTKQSKNKNDDQDDDNDFFICQSQTTEEIHITNYVPKTEQIQGLRIFLQQALNCQLHGLFQMQNCSQIRNITIYCNQISDFPIKYYVSQTKQKSKLKIQGKLGKEPLHILCVTNQFFNDIDINHSQKQSISNFLCIIFDKMIRNSIKNSIKSITSLKLCNCKIKSINFIEFFSFIEEINFSHNQIISIQKLKKLENQLVKLNLSYNRISSVSALKTKTNLSILLLSHNNIQTIYPLLDLHKLIILNISYNPLLDLMELQLLKRFPKIMKFDCRNTFNINQQHVSNIILENIICSGERDALQDQMMFNKDFLLTQRAIDSSISKTFNNNALKIEISNQSKYSIQKLVHPVQKSKSNNSKEMTIINQIKFFKCEVDKLQTQIINMKQTYQMYLLQYPYIQQTRYTLSSIDFINLLDDSDKQNEQFLQKNSSLSIEIPQNFESKLQDLQKFIAKFKTVHLQCYHKKQLMQKSLKQYISEQSIIKHISLQKCVNFYQLINFHPQLTSLSLINCDINSLQFIKDIKEPNKITFICLSDNPISSFAELEYLSVLKQVKFLDFSHTPIQRSRYFVWLLLHFISDGVKIQQINNDSEATAYYYYLQDSNNRKKIETWFEIIKELKSKEKSINHVEEIQQNQKYYNASFLKTYISHHQTQILSAIYVSFFDCNFINEKSGSYDIAIGQSTQCFSLINDIRQKPIKIRIDENLISQSLYCIHISGYLFESLNFLRSTSHLIILDLSNTNISELLPLQNQYYLKDLNVSKNNIFKETELQVLFNMPMLVSFDILENPVMSYSEIDLILAQSINRECIYSVNGSPELTKRLLVMKDKLTLTLSVFCETTIQKIDTVKFFLDLQQANMPFLPEQKSFSQEKAAGKEIETEKDKKPQRGKFQFHSSLEKKRLELETQQTKKHQMSIFSSTNEEVPDFKCIPQSTNKIFCKSTSTISLSGINQLKVLSTLRVQDGSIKKTDDINNSENANLSKIQYLILNEQQLEQVCIQNHQSLNYLEIFKNKNSINEKSILLYNINNLVTIHIVSSQLASLTFVINLTSLENINVSQNSIFSIFPLRNLKKLTYLDIEENKLENEQELLIILQLNNMKYLNYQKNKIEKSTETKIILQQYNINIKYILPQKKPDFYQKQLRVGHKHIHMEAIIFSEEVENVDYFQCTIENLSKLFIISKVASESSSKLIQIKVNKCISVNKECIFTIIENIIFSNLQDCSIYNCQNVNGVKIEGLQNLRTINIRGNSFINKFIHLQNLKNLKCLDLSFNKMTSIVPVCNLISLEVLYINDNTIEENSIEDLQMLTNLSELRIFHCYNNGFTKLPNIYDYMVEALSKLPEEVFVRCYNDDSKEKLSRLFLLKGRVNPFRSIILKNRKGQIETTLEKSSKNTLRIECEDCERLSLQGIKEAVNVIEIVISKCCIVQKSIKVFQQYQFAHLQKMKIENSKDFCIYLKDQIALKQFILTNEIINIEDRKIQNNNIVLYNLPKLETLQINNYQLSQLDEMQHINSLKILNLSHNQIESIKCLYVIRNLEELYINCNKLLEQSEFQIFIEFERLLILECYENKYFELIIDDECNERSQKHFIKVLAFCLKESIQHIVIEKGKEVTKDVVKLMPEAKKGVQIFNQEVEQFTIQYNRSTLILCQIDFFTKFALINQCKKLLNVSAINCTTQNPNSLKQITISYCTEIVHIRSFQNSFPYLSRLIIQFCPNLKKIEVTNQPELQFLNLRSNGLKVINLQKLSKLTILFIQFNQLQTLDCVEKLDNLQTLVCNNNYIQSILPLFSQQHLKKIFMHKNKVQSQNELESFAHMAELRVLSVYGNRFVKKTPRTRQMIETYIDPRIKQLSRILQHKVKFVFLDDNLVNSAQTIKKQQKYIRRIERTKVMLQQDDQDSTAGALQVLEKLQIQSNQMQDVDKLFVQQEFKIVSRSKENAKSTLKQCKNAIAFEKIQQGKSQEKNQKQASKYNELMQVGGLQEIVKEDELAVNSLEQSTLTNIRERSNQILFKQQQICEMELKRERDRQKNICNLHSINYVAKDIQQLQNQKQQLEESRKELEEKTKKQLEQAELLLQKNVPGVLPKIEAVKK